MSKVRVWAGLVPSRGCEGMSCLRLSPWLVDGLLRVHVAFSLRGCVCPGFLLFNRHQPYWIGTLPDDLTLT